MFRRLGHETVEVVHAEGAAEMRGIRNPGAHELAAEQDPQEVLEYLALASLLHRRLDSE